MANCVTRSVGMRCALLAALGVLGVNPGLVLGQEAKSVVRAGYTRPGNPPDEVTKDGKIRFLAHDPAYENKVIGGTVFFAVFERVGKENDPFGTGMAGLGDSFQPGKDMQNNVSP